VWGLKTWIPRASCQRMISDQPGTPYSPPWVSAAPATRSPPVLRT
jgi:hypothetical protein